MKDMTSFRAEVAKLCEPSGALLPAHVQQLAKWLRLRSAILWSSDFEVLDPHGTGLWPVEQAKTRGSVALSFSAEASLGAWAKAPFDQAVPNLLTLAGARDFERVLMLGDTSLRGGSTDAELLRGIDGLARRASETMDAEELPWRPNGRNNLHGLCLIRSRHTPGVAVLITPGALRVRIGDYVETSTSEREVDAAVVEGVKFGRVLATVTYRFWLHILPTPPAARLICVRGDVRDRNGDPLGTSRIDTTTGIATRAVVATSLDTAQIGVGMDGRIAELTKAAGLGGT